MLVTLTLHARANRGLASWSNEPPREMSTTSRQHVDPPSLSLSSLPTRGRPPKLKEVTREKFHLASLRLSLSSPRIIFLIPTSFLFFAPRYPNALIAVSPSLNVKEPTRERETPYCSPYLAFFARIIYTYVHIYTRTHIYIYISYDVWVRYAFDARWKLRDEGFEISWSRSRTRTLFSNKEAR